MLVSTASFLVGRSFVQLYQRLLILVLLGWLRCKFGLDCDGSCATLNHEQLAWVFKKGRFSSA